MNRETELAKEAGASKVFEWIVSLFVFPSGIISVIIMLLIVRRSEKPLKRAEENVKKAAGLRIQVSTLRRLREDEISKVCKQFQLSSRRRAELQRAGKIDKYSCGMCMGEGRGAFLQLPCGDLHHVGCMKRGLQQDLATCADCGFSVKSVFDIEPDLPKERD